MNYNDEKVFRMQPNKNLMSFRQSHLCGHLRPQLDIPGDKSISHRALFLSALATGNTLITGLNHGEDLEHTQMALEATVSLDGDASRAVWQEHYPQLAGWCAAVSRGSALAVTLARTV